MALINCPQCGKQVSDKAARCPHCDFDFAIQTTSNLIPKTIRQKATPPRKKWLYFVIIGLSLVAACAALWFFVYNHAPRSKQNTTEETEQIYGDLKLLKVTNIKYDNSLTPQAGNTYEASNLCDGNCTTAWAVNLDKAIYDCDMLYGPTFSIKCKKLSYIIVHNGYCKNEDSFKNNTRAAKVVIYSYNERSLNGNEHILFDGSLKDISTPQRLDMSSDIEKKTVSCK